MPDLKVMDADRFETELRECAQRATQVIADTANKAIADVRTVAWTQTQLAPKSASDLVVESRVALVQDLEIRPEHGQLHDLDVELQLLCDYKASRGELRSGRLQVPPGKYRLLVFLVDAREPAPPAELCSCAYAATAHAKTPQCPVVFSGLEDEE